MARHGGVKAPGREDSALAFKGPLGKVPRTTITARISGSTYVFLLNDIPLGPFLVHSESQIMSAQDNNCLMN